MWYGVRVGRAPGVYATLERATEQVHGYSRNEWRAFVTKEKATAYVGNSSEPAATASGASLAVAVSATASGRSETRDLPSFAVPRFELSYDSHELQRILSTEMLASRVIGLDLEWTPDVVPRRFSEQQVAAGVPTPLPYYNSKRAALVQLATPSVVVLVPLRHLRALPPALAQLLADPAVWKVGCGITGDAAKLHADFGLQCQSVVELEDMARALQREGLRWPARTGGLDGMTQGLKSLAAALGTTLEKPKYITMSDWEFQPLSERQVEYAATDAYAGLWIAQCLHRLGDSGHSPMELWLQSRMQPPGKRKREDGDLE